MHSLLKILNVFTSQWCVITANLKAILEFKWKNISWKKNSKKMCELGNYSILQKVNHYFQTIYILEECFEGWNHTPDFFHFLLKKGGRL